MPLSIVCAALGLQVVSLRFNANNVKPITSNSKQSCKGWIVSNYASIGAHYGDFAAVLHYLRYKGHMPELEKGTDPLFLDPTKGNKPAPDFDEPPPYQEPGRRRLARHHGGPLLNRMWGLAWAHAYLGVLAEAMREVVQQDARLVKRKEPPVRGCQKSLCETQMPVCSTTVEPRVITDPQMALESLAVPGHRWSIAELENRQGLIDKFGYVDRKIQLSADSAKGPITFKFTTKTKDMPIVMCEVPCAWGRCKGGRVPLLGNSKFQLDGRDLGNSDLMASGNGKLKDLLAKDTCMVLSSSVPAGEHHLIVESTAGPGKPIAISHLIYY